MKTLRNNVIIWMLNGLHFMRAPVGVFLFVSAGVQVVAAVTPLLHPIDLGVPDLIPAANTVVLALIWWRVTQLENYRDKMEKRDEADRELNRRKGH